MLDAVVQFGELRVAPSLGLQRVFFFVFFKAFLLLFFMYLFIFFYRWLVQAWALFKGKFREGIDKPDPPTWKTRLRCALNKSNDFEELVERSQLDISDPYKVYRIVPEGAKKSQSHTKTHIDRFKQMILQHHSEPKWGNLSGNSLNTHLTAQCSENHQWRSHCIMGFFYFAFRLHILFFCVARRTPTGGQSSESDGLSGAPVLPCAADSGEFHTHGNERSGLQREWEREGLNVKQKQWTKRQTVHAWTSSDTVTGLWVTSLTDAFKCWRRKRKPSHRAGKCRLCPRYKDVTFRWHKSCENHVNNRWF